MKIINVHQGKTHLSRITKRVANGESVIIAKAGKPVAVLSPYIVAGSARKAGSMKGKMRIADDFDAADAVMADMFKGAGESG